MKKNLLSWKNEFIFSTNSNILYKIKYPWTGIECFRSFSKVSPFLANIYSKVDGRSSLDDISWKISEEECIDKGKALKLCKYILKEYTDEHTDFLRSQESKASAESLDKMVNAIALSDNGNRYKVPQNIFWALPYVSTLPEYIYIAHQEAGRIGVRNIFYEINFYSKEIISLFSLCKRLGINIVANVDERFSDEQLRSILSLEGIGVNIKIQAGNKIFFRQIVRKLSFFNNNFCVAILFDFFTKDTAFLYLEEILDYHPEKVYMLEKTDTHYLSSLEINQLKEDISRFSSQYDVAVYFSPACSNPYAQNDLHPCSKFGRMNIAVRADGKVHICNEKCFDEFVVGDLTTQTIEEIWSSSICETWINHKDINYIHSTCVSS